jgi:four helix bundle protein
MAEGNEAAFEKLVVWQRAHQLTLAVYDLSKSFPSEEKFALTDQLRRAASSVPMNIAEGHASGSDRIFLRHLAIAQGSLAEVRYCLILARDLQYLSPDTHDRAADLAGEVSRLLTAFRRKVEERCTPPPSPPLP